MKVIGTAIFIVCVIALFAFEMIWFFRWWGIVGVVVGLLIPPMVAAFPFIHLVQEGLSLLYLGLWVAGVVGLLMVFYALRDDPDW